MYPTVQTHSHSESPKWGSNTDHGTRIQISHIENSQNNHVCWEDRNYLRKREAMFPWLSKLCWSQRNLNDTMTEKAVMLHSMKTTTTKPKQVRSVFRVMWKRLPVSGEDSFDTEDTSITPGRILLVCGRRVGWWNENSVKLNTTGKTSLNNTLRTASHTHTHGWHNST